MRIIAFFLIIFSFIENYEISNYEKPNADNHLAIISGRLDANLDPDVAYEIIMEAQHLELLIVRSGFESRDDCLEWLKIPENIVKNVVDDEEINKDPLVYYSTEFDTMEKFDSFFGNIFTDNSLEILKKVFRVKEVNGKLAAVNSEYMIGMGSTYIAWEDSHVIEIIREDDSNKAKAVVETVCAIQEVEENGRAEFDFEYSEEYGWRIDFNSKNYFLF